MLKTREMDECFTETHREGQEPVYFILMDTWENLVPIKLTQPVDSWIRRKVGYRMVHTEIKEEDTRQIW